MANFWFCQDGGRPPWWSFKSWKFNLRSTSEAQYASLCQIWCWSVKPLRRYDQFFLFIPAVCYLGFLKLRNFNFLSCSEAQYASPCQISCQLVKLLWTYGRFSNFSKRWPSAILQLFYVFGPPTKGGIWWPCDCAKFDSNQRSNFNSVQGLIFCTLSSKRPIHAPKIEFFGIWPPKWAAVWTRPPKGTSLHRTTSYDI